MRGIYFGIAILLILLSGCSNNASAQPIRVEKNTDVFNLVFQSDKGTYQKDEGINFEAYFEYVGEGEVKLGKTPLILINVKEKGNEKIIKQIKFTDVRPTMKKGERFSKKIKGLKLDKGKYEINVEMEFFSVGTTNYLLGTRPSEFLVK